MDLNGLPFDDDFTFVRLVKSIQDVHQSSLPSAVFSEQGQNLTLIECEVDMVVGQNARELLGDSLEFKNRWHRNPLISGNIIE